MKNFFKGLLKYLKSLLGSTLFFAPLVCATYAVVICEPTWKIVAAVLAVAYVMSVAYLWQMDVVGDSVIVSAPDYVEDDMADDKYPINKSAKSPKTKKSGTKTNSKATK